MHFKNSVENLYAGEKKKTRQSKLYVKTSLFST